MRLYSQLRWVYNVKGRNSCLLCSTFAAHARNQQTSHTTQDKKMKVDATLSNMTYAFPQLLGHMGTLTTSVIIMGVLPHSGLLVIRPGPPSQTVLCLLISPMLRNTVTGYLKSSGLWITNVQAPSLTSHSDHPRQTQSLPSLCFKSRLASPNLTSTDRASHYALHTRPGHRAPSHRHTRLLHTLRILRKNANKLADFLLVSPQELSHQHSRVMWALLLVMQ